MRVRRLLPLVLACALTPAAPAQQPTPSPQQSPTPAPSDIDVRMIRLKISAGDLPSAESILEYHRAEKGEDGDYLLGMAWVARGAALMGDWKAASRWAESARQMAESRLKTPADYESNREAVYALGTAIEIRAQALAAAGKKREAVRFLEESSREQERAPYNLRARIWKRRNMIELEGNPAPAIHSEDHVGAEFQSLEALRGKPVVLFFWWEACGDCRMQAGRSAARGEVRPEGSRLRRADPLLRPPIAAKRSRRSRSPGKRSTPCPTPSPSPSATKRCCATAFPRRRPSSFSIGKAMSFPTPRQE